MGRVPGGRGVIPSITLADLELGPRPAYGLRVENRGITSQRHHAITRRKPARLLWHFERDVSGAVVRMRAGYLEVCV